VQERISDSQKCPDTEGEEDEEAVGRKVLQAAKCSQMTNPTRATGSGGNRF